MCLKVIYKRFHEQTLEYYKNYENNDTKDRPYYLYDNRINAILLNYYLYIYEKDIVQIKNNFDYINQILKILNLKVSDIVFKSNDESFGYFNNNSKVIFINIDSLIELYINNIISKEQLIIEYFNILFHEITHLIQDNLKSNNPGSIKTEINKISNNLKILAGKDRSHIYHNLFPHEREANIESARQVYLFIKSNYKHLKAIRKKADYNLLFFLSLDATKDNKWLPFSTFNYLYKMIVGYDFKIKNIENSLSEYQKIIYGFSIKNKTRKSVEESLRTEKCNKTLQKVLKI